MALIFSGFGDPTTGETVKDFAVIAVDQEVDSSRIRLKADRFHALLL